MGSQDAWVGVVGLIVGNLGRALTPAVKQLLLWAGCALLLVGSALLVARYRGTRLRAGRRATAHADARSRAIGVLGEGLVTAEVEKTGWPVLRNLVLEVDGRTVEVDHAIRVPDGVILLEVKTYAGFVSGTEDLPYWTQVVGGRRSEFLNPVRQSLAHVHAVERFLQDDGVRVRGLVVSAGRARFAPELSRIVVPLMDLRRALHQHVPTDTVQPAVTKAWARLMVEAALSDGRRAAHVAFASSRKRSFTAAS